MALTKQQRERLQRTEFWEHAVANMSTFEIPEGYEAAGKKDKYERFTGYLKEWIINLFISSKNTRGIYGKEPTDKTEFIRAIVGQFELNKSQKDLLWQEAIEVGSGKKSVFDENFNYNTLLTPLKFQENEHIKAVYDMFMPTYHAIKEKFEKRWWFEWIFNHKQYVAERDSLIAIEGIFRELIGYPKEYTEEKLSDFRNELTELRKANNEVIDNDHENQLNESIEQINVIEEDEINNGEIVEEIEENDLTNKYSLNKPNRISI